MFGRKRQQQEREQEAAREAERRALFEELAKRPDTICPFLGLADARAEYRDRVSDAHRCYAFGDPAELSAEQQQKVCLQRGYGNCPRYLRGVLVIPTEELEALRRPQPAPPPPAAVGAASRAAPAPVAARSGRGRALVMALGVVLLVGALGGAGWLYISDQVASSAVRADLPGGTDVGAELVSLSAPRDGEQELRGTAFIGETQATTNTTLVYVLDLSATTLRGAGCGGDANADGMTNTPLDCEIEAAAALNAQAVENGTVAEVALVGFANGVVTADLAPEGGEQPLVSPAADDDGDGVPNVVEAMRSAFSGSERQVPAGFRSFTEVQAVTGRTAFSDGIEAACAVVDGSASANHVVVFLSDGENRGGVPVSDVLPCATDVVFQTFAAGTDTSCIAGADFGSLRDVSTLTGGSCTEVTDVTELPQILQAVVAPQLVRVELSIDDGEPIDVTPGAAPDLPLSGPGQITVTVPIPALGDGDHRICMTVHASDAGGPGSVKSCSPARREGGRLTTSG